MMQRALHTAPRLRAVLWAQIRAVTRSLKWPAVAATMLVGAATVIIRVDVLGAGGSVDFAPQLSMLPGMLALLLPIGVWIGEERFGAGPLWTLPVDRSFHALAKAFAGWVWLMVVVALFVVWLLALTLLTGGNLLAEEMLRVLPSSFPAPTTLPPPGTLDPAGLQTMQWTPTPLLWLVPFTAATGAYLLASAFALGVRHPLRWIVGTLLTLFLIVTAGDVTNTRWVAETLNRALEPLYFGPYGFDALLTARTESLKTVATLSTGETVSVWRGVPDLGQWATATLLWTGAGLVALLAAAWRHRECR